MLKLYATVAALIIALGLNAYQVYTIEHVKNNYRICEADKAAIQNAVETARTLENEQADRLKKEEQKIDKIHKRNIKRISQYKTAAIPKDCKAAIRYGLINR